MFFKNNVYLNTAKYTHCFNISSLCEWKNIIKHLHIEKGLFNLNTRARLANIQQNLGNISFILLLNNYI